jgi:carnitine 3-dehydrogenase
MPATVKTATIIGGGVIGGGWAARFLLNGWNVKVSDPDPEAERKIAEVLANARRSLPGLSDVSMPREGKLTFCGSIAEAVAEADWIQESVPERIEIKHAVLAEVQAHCKPDAVVASSTSGFKPSELQQGATNPGQIIVCHPFNPVYLLPLVEVVGGDGAAPETMTTASAVLTGLGMKPLIVRKEIDAHIADRFLEAVWREGLWLINDGIATTEEIDDAIRYGFGIRWAQMGLFETYRVAGGEAGMKHFIAQFGPCLSLPWTKLMDVPELTDKLVDTIASQSDAQSGMHTIRELERIRDNNLVAMMRALKGQNSGAGALLNDHDSTVRDKSSDEIDFSKPIQTMARAIPLDWVDYNGHMNEARYLQTFSEGTDRFMEIIGCDAEYIASGGSYFTVETHIRHLDEVHAGARVYVETQCISAKGKKMHLFNSLYHEDGKLLATGEHMLLHVSLDTRRATPPSDKIATVLNHITSLHSDLLRPEGLGRGIAQG